MGMETTDSLALLSTQAQNGTVNLNKLASALRDVTDTAATAGLNTEIARQSFAKTFDTLLSAGYGQSATTLAHAQTNTFSSMGPTVAGASYDLTSPTAVARLAGINGLTLGQQQARSENNPLLTAQGQAGIINQILPGAQSAYGPAWGGLQSQIQTAKNRLKPGQSFTTQANPDIIRAITDATVGGTQQMQQELNAADIKTTDASGKSLGEAGIKALYANFISGNMSGSGPSSPITQVQNAQRQQATADKLAHPGVGMQTFGQVGGNVGKGVGAGVGGGIGAVAGLGIFSPFTAPIGAAIGEHIGGPIGGFVGNEVARPVAGAVKSGFDKVTNKFDAGRHDVASVGHDIAGFFGFGGGGDKPKPPTPKPKPPVPTPPQKVQVVLSWKDPSWGARVSAAVQQVPTNSNQIPPNPYPAN